MKISKKYLLILFVPIFLVHFLNFFWGPIHNHSNFLNVNWFHGFWQNLAAGNFVPRWLMDQFGGSGSPTFYYYAPLPFYLASLPKVLTFGWISTEAALGIGWWLAHFLAALTFYFSAQSFCRPSYALLGALVYSFAPYHFEVNYWHRGAFGEFTAYIFVPLLFKYLHRLDRGTVRDWLFYALTYALLLLTHLPSALLVSIFLGCYFIFKWWGTKNGTFLSRYVSGTLLGAGLSAYYWLPPLQIVGIHTKRDKLPSIAYSEELIFSISATLQSTDRHHGIVGQECCHFQLDS